MGVIVINSPAWEKLSQYSGNPFLDTMTDLQGLFSTLYTYYQNKPYIDKYSDISLSDLKDKIKTYLPEAIGKDGNIDFSKIEELANQGNKLAEYILTIKQHRENFVNAPIGGKLEAIKNDTLRDILSGNGLTKEATVLKKMRQIDDFLQKANIPNEWKMLLSLNKEKFLSDPNLFALVFGLFGNQQTPQTNNQSNTSSNEDDNSSEAEYIKSIIENNSPQTSTSEAGIIKSIIENNPSQSLTPEKKKQIITKLKQVVEAKKKQKQNKQSQQKPTQQIQQSQQTNSDLGIVFPWQNISLPILPYENLPPKITSLW